MAFPLSSNSKLDNFIAFLLNVLQLPSMYYIELFSICCLLLRMISSMNVESDRDVDECGVPTCGRNDVKSMHREQNDEGGELCYCRCFKTVCVSIFTFLSLTIFSVIRRCCNRREAGGSKHIYIFIVGRTDDITIFC